MFDLVKQKVSLILEIEKSLGVTLKPSGERNWKIDGGREVEQCPQCEHRDCFSVYQEGDDLSSARYKCFSCTLKGDVISWRAWQGKVTQAEAARQLAHEAGIPLPSNYNPVQEVFTLAAEYYHTCLIETCVKPIAGLLGKTPLQYQEEIRGHKKETLERFKIGFSDGGLAAYLEGLGLDKEAIAKSGLVNRFGKDFFMSNTFIYPHYHKNKVSHFTFKDPLKRSHYQLNKSHTLNECEFYGQDEFAKNDLIFLVEGENDYLSIREWVNPDPTAKKVELVAVAMIGSISADQIKWMKQNCRKNRVITLFDPDHAGDKYRRTLEGLRKHFTGLIHVLPPDGKDIDENLRAGKNFMEIVRDCKVEVSAIDENSPAGIVDAVWKDLSGEPEKEPRQEDVAFAADPLGNFPAEPVLSEGMYITGPTPEVVEPQHRIPAKFDSDDDEDSSSVVEAEDINVIQRKGCYLKIVRNKDGVDKEVRLSNFTIQLINVFEGDTDDRTREIILIRMDGLKSKPFLVDSETKVTSKLFKVAVARYADCEWMGREPELDAVWRLVYNKFPDVTIYVPSHVGRHDKLNCWIFRNILITGSGIPFAPDENGVFWPGVKSRGVKPIGVSKDDGPESIPALSMGLTRDETKVMLGKVLQGLTLVLKEPGAALMAMGWIYSNVYSNEIFKSNGGMGSLMFWGIAGKGKSTVARWLQSFYGLSGKMASTSVQQLKSSVGFMRKAEYYSSLPMFLDELRADDQSGMYLGMIRSWYDREGRTTADYTDRKKINNQKINATLMIGGEDLPEDPATKERCIMIRVPPSDSKREEYRANYDTMESLCDKFSNITYFWILDSCRLDKSELIKEMRKLDTELVLNGCSNRISKVWSGAAYFAQLLCKEYYPDYDFMNYLIVTSKEEQIQQKNDNTLARFWQAASVACVGKDDILNDEHIGIDSRDPDKINIWYPAVFKAVNDTMRDSKDKFSKHAVLRSIREEKYFLEEDRRVSMGLNQTRRSVLTLRLKDCPNDLKSIVGALEEVECTTETSVENSR